jgi:hypothetical protein
MMSAAGEKRCFFCCYVSALNSSQPQTPPGHAESRPTGEPPAMYKATIDPRSGVDESIENTKVPHDSFSACTPRYPAK